MYKTLRLIPILLIFVVFVTSCGSSSSLAGTPVTDEEFDAAVKEAHGTLGTLRTALLSPRDSYIFVGLKVRFTGDGIYEDIWTEPVDYFDGYFTTRMIDGVLIDSNLNADRLVTVPLDKVLDWVIVEEDGHLIGGYTIRLSYEHMTPDEKVEFLKATGYKID
ncbi:MAG: hypothetical protein C3F07_17010 [Anaerolineales bacterium]|nr:DUF2314 domain-containing protein [Anaerolineae bacterium]PWB70410.1 MAG: hypothetical protein C3F07_17010 [Anaerolineales bacterium]